MLTDKFSERLKHWRERRGLSQAALARAVGVSQPMIAQWEMGIRYPSVNSLEAVLKSLNVTFNDFFGEE